MSQEPQMLFVNHYRCPACQHEWANSWDSTCDDDCPACGNRHISPHHSDDITTHPVVSDDLCCFIQ
jgi:rubrerythrin